MNENITIRNTDKIVTGNTELVELFNSLYINLVKKLWKYCKKLKETQNLNIIINLLQSLLLNVRAILALSILKIALLTKNILISLQQ